jgi:hypothetical protein
MNILGYHRSENHILSFELTIDGEFNLLLFCFSQTNYDDVVTGIFKEIQESEIVQQIEKLIAENVNG